MSNRRSPWRDLIVFSLPCTLLVLAGSIIARRPRPLAPKPQVLPTPTPKGFWVEVSRFGREKVNPFNAKVGADTCVSVVTIARNAPPNVRWFVARRVVAIKNNRARVLWDGKEFSETGQSKPSAEWVLAESGGTSDLRHDSLLFKLRGLPPDVGQVVFAWDALAQPVTQAVPWGEPKEVTLAELNRAAKFGGVRLSRRCVLWRDGETILPPRYTPHPALRVLKATARPQRPQDGGEIEVALHLALDVPESKDDVTAPDGLAIRDEKGRDLRLSYNDTASYGDGTCMFTATVKKSSLRGVRRLRVSAMISDGDSLPARFEAIAKVDLAK